MIAPIDIECPYCKATIGNYCTVAPDVPTTVTFHHADRVDAAARRVRVPSDRPDSQEFLIVRRSELRRLRSVYEAAIDWRRHVALMPAEPLTKRMIEAIDAAITAEAPK